MPRPIRLVPASRVLFLVQDIPFSAAVLKAHLDSVFGPSHVHDVVLPDMGPASRFSNQVAFALMSSPSAATDLLQAAAHGPLQHNGRPLAIRKVTKEDMGFAATMLPGYLLFFEEDLPDLVKTPASSRSISAAPSQSSDVFSDGTDSVGSTVPTSPITPSSTNLPLPSLKPTPFYTPSSPSPYRIPSPDLFSYILTRRPRPSSSRASALPPCTSSADRPVILFTLPGSSLPESGTQSFQISPDQAAAAERWVEISASSSETDDYLSYELACHRSDTYMSARAEDVDVSMVPTCWPHEAPVVVALSVLPPGVGWTYTLDPQSYHDFLIEAGSPFPLDITHLIRPGTMRMHISAIEDVSDYIFVLKASRPAGIGFVKWEDCEC